MKPPGGFKETIQRDAQWPTEARWGLPILVMPELGRYLSREAPVLQYELLQPLTPLPAFPPLLLQAGTGSSLASPPSQPVPLG